MNALAWLDESFSLRFVLALLHFLWQGALIAVAARTIEQLFRRSSAQAKYLLHIVAMAAMACCLPITYARIGSSPEVGENLVSSDAALPPGRLAERTTLEGGVSHQFGLSEQISGKSSQAGRSVSAAAGGELMNDASRITVLEDRAAMPASDTPLSLPPDDVSSPSQSWLSTLAPYITVGYLLCVVGLIARLALGIWGGHKLRAATVVVADRDLLAAIARQARQIGLRAAPIVAYCERVSVPVVVGVLRPMILLPTALASGLTPNQLEVLIAHELAHIRRWDPLVNLIERVVEALLFFHPAVWYIGRRIRVQRENASDDLVLRAGWQGLQYADALVRMAELAASRRGGEAAPYLAIAASGGSPSEFKRRVMRLLDPEPAHFRLTNVGWLAFVLIVASAVAAPLAVRAWAQAASADAKSERESTTDDGEQLGRQVADFRLQDYLGAEHSLSDFADREVVVIAFLGVECPVSKIYGPRLESLARRFQSKSVAIIGVDSNQQDTPTELGHYARSHGITFPLLKDPASRVADRLGAERTPEALVLDRDRKVRYRGRIDDQFGVGYARQEATQEYVAAAVDDLLSGRPVKTPEVEAIGCHIGRVSRVPPQGDVTYAKQISRVIQRRCVECHRSGGIAPFALDSYDAVAAWAETIREVVGEGRMPPWHASPKYGHFANDGRMPEAEKALIERWVANGVPQGADGDLPPRRDFADGWALGTPDLLLTVAEPITIPPSGVVEYQYVTVDPGFIEGKWIRASEIHPGVRSVVHHIAVFIDPPGGDPILKERGIGLELVGGYVPGSAPMNLGEGVARYVPRGSKFVFQIHYTPDGVERQDQSQIGLYFADPATVRHTMQTGVAANLNFEIPAGADNYSVESAHRFSHDMEIHSLAPHMHYRGKSFRFEATYPNGSREILLDVPRYDFNWQHSYKLARPKFMPEGTLLRCVAHFDNSPANLANPDPTASVRWGEQTWNEMMIGYFEGVFLNQDLSLPPPRITATGDGHYLAHFSYRPDRPARNVNLAGTFNKWNTSSHPLTDSDGDGVYETDVSLDAGEYRYKFVLDGDYWTHDPASRILTGFVHESFFVAGASDALPERNRP